MGDEIKRINGREKSLPKGEARFRKETDMIEKYRCYATEELISIYTWEANRVNKDDANITRALIKKELKRRFAAVLEMMDEEESDENAHGIYRYLIGE